MVLAPEAEMQVAVGREGRVTLTCRARVLSKQRRQSISYFSVLPLLRLSGPEECH